MSEIGSAFEQLTRRQEQLAEVVSGVLTHAQAVGQDLARSTAPVSSALSSLKESADTVTAGLSQLRELTGVLSAAARTLEGSQQRTAETWATYDARFREIDEALARCVHKLVDGVEDLGAQSGKFMAELDQHLGSAVSGLAGVARELSETADELLQGRGGVA